MDGWMDGWMDGCDTPTFLFYFYTRDALLKRGLCCRPVSVCLSVFPSFTLVDCIHTAEDIVELLFGPVDPSL